MKRIQFKTFRLTPQAARDFLAINVLEQQRSVNQRRLVLLRDKIKDGLFRHADIGVGILGSQRILVNGQHSCHAVDDLSATVDAVLEEYEVANEEELSLLFRQYDNQVSSRTLRDLLKMEAHALQVGDLPERIISLTIGALSINETKVMQMTADQKADLLKMNINRAAYLHQLIYEDGHACDFISRAAVCAAMLRTWEKNKEKSMSFWRQVRNGEDLKRYDPPKLLRDFLMSVTVNRGIGATSRTAVSNHEILYRSIGAWNNFRSGTQPNCIKFFPNREIPKAL